jgi:hypothetical protein
MSLPHIVDNYVGQNCQHCKARLMPQVAKERGMRIIHQNSIAWGGVSKHRDATIVFKRLITGPFGTPDAFELALVRMDGRYTTPRHRHNYDQIRFPLSGPGINYGPAKEVPTGAVSYFPESTYYGPQDIPPGGIAMALQFGGASGQGMLSYDDLGRASKELSEIGSFEAGVFKQELPDGRKINKDGFEAVWEHITGKPLVYPPARFAEPVVMHPEAFAWQNGGQGHDATGVASKHLGTFGERHVTLRLVRLMGGSLVLKPSARCLGFVYKGEGRAGDETIGLHDAFEVLPGDVMKLSGDGLEILLMDIPSLQTSAKAA